MQQEVGRWTDKETVRRERLGDGWVTGVAWGVQHNEGKKSFRKQGDPAVRHMGCYEDTHSTPCTKQMIDSRS